MYIVIVDIEDWFAPSSLLQCKSVNGRLRREINEIDEDGIRETMKEFCDIHSHHLRFYN